MIKQMEELLAELEIDASSSQVEIRKRTLGPKLENLGVECPSIYANTSFWRHYLILLISMVENEDYEAAREIVLPEEWK